MNIPIARMLVTACALAFMLSSHASAQVQILRQVIGSGATAAAGPSGAIAATVGQTIIGPATSSTHAGYLGFWYTYPRQTSSAEEYSSAVTGRSASLRVVPNPVADNATIVVGLPAGAEVTLKLYSAIGDERATLIEGYRFAGSTTVRISAHELESGHYTLVLQTPTGRVSTPLQVVR